MQHRRSAAGELCSSFVYHRMRRRVVCLSHKNATACILMYSTKVIYVYTAHIIIAPKYRLAQTIIALGYELFVYDGTHFGECDGYIR